MASIVLLGPSKWNLLFVGINAMWVARLFWEAQVAHTHITAEEEELHACHFAHMSEADFWQGLAMLRLSSQPHWQLFCP